jgi:hypothetical protein
VRAGLQLFLQPRLVEPGCGDLTAAVRDLRREDLEPAAAAPQRRPHHVALDHDLVVAAEREQLADAPLRRRVLIAPRPVVEQVADALEAELREPLAERRPDAGERVERRVQSLGPEAATRRRPSVGRVHGGETGGNPAHGSSMANSPAGKGARLCQRPIDDSNGCPQLVRGERNELVLASSSRRRSSSTRAASSSVTTRSVFLHDADVGQ